MRLRRTALRLKDVVLIVVTSLLSGIALSLVLWLLTSIFLIGLKPILKEGLKVLIEEPDITTSPEYGGIGPMIVGTLEIVGLALLMGLPVGIGAGIYMYLSPRSKLAIICRRLLEVIVEAPTICYGVVVYFTLILTTGKLATIFSSLCLVFIVMSYIAIQICDILRTLPPELAETCYALGLSTGRTVLMLLRFAARPVAASIVISIAKVLGETGPLLITALFYANWGTWVFDPLNQAAPALTTFIYYAAKNPLEKVKELGWTACLVLTLITLGLFTLARLIAREKK